MIDAFLSLTPAEQTAVLALPAALLIIVAWLAYRVRALKSRAAVGVCAQEIPHTGTPRQCAVRVSKVHNVGRRESQQDCMAVSPMDNGALTSAKGVLAVVADGMGGLADGGEISMRVARSMLQSFSRDGAADAPRQELLCALGRANDEVNAYLGSENFRKSGSTLVAANIRGGKLWWVSVGDSRIFLYRGGAVVALNRRHNYAGELDVMQVNGEADVRAAAEDPDREHLTSFIGMGRLKYVDGNTVPLKLLPGDRVILASDGVSEVLSQGEIAAAQLCPIEESAGRIERAVLDKARPHQDNFTAVIMEYA